MTQKPHKTCYIRTFGCQMNEHDSQKMRLILARAGYGFAPAPDDADLILINTCTIREKAYHKAESEIGRVLSLKHQRPGQIVGVCGCVAQQEGGKLFDRYPHLNLIFGPDQIDKLPLLLQKLENTNTAMALDLINAPEQYNFISDVPTRVKSGHAFATVSKGCNCFCTYCIVPAVRGREVSRPADDIINEIKTLSFGGVKEVTLLGQNVTSYRSSGYTLASLIERISKETDIRGVRFTSPHPKDITDELIGQFAKNPALCPHLHLPAQSGSNAMLKKMGRGYTRERYLDIVCALRSARPDISITSDFIVGFSGEGEEDFGQTMDLLRSVQFDSIFAFRYSVRPGTPAAKKFKDDVPPAIKEERLEKVLAYQRRVTLKKNESLVGQIHEVLVTGADRKKTGRLTGRLPNNRIVNFTGQAPLIGRIVRLRLIRALNNSMEGEIAV